MVSIRRSTRTERPMGKCMSTHESAPLWKVNACGLPFIPSFEDCDGMKIQGMGRSPVGAICKGKSLTASYSRFYFWIVERDGSALRISITRDKMKWGVMNC